MSIRIKLILTYAILVMISVFVLVFSGIAIVSSVVQTVAETVIEENDIHTVVTQTIDLLAELKQAQDYEPAKLTDPEQIKSLSERTDFYNGGLIVRYGDRVMNYSDLPKDEDFYSYLEPTPVDRASHVKGPSEEEHFIDFGSRKYFYIDYTFELEGEDVVYFFVVDMTKSTKLRSTTGKKMVQMILVILLIIITPLLFIITNDIIRPIRKLEEGVRHIKNGNLDFELKSKNNNEIGRVIRYFDVMRAELKSSIEKQIRFEENRKHLISSISHDLKTPITSIKGYIEGIKDGVANTPEKTEKYLDVIYQKSKDMDQLIDDLFLFSKLDLNKLPYEMEEVPIKAYLETIINEMKLDWESDVRTLDLVIDERLDEQKVTIDQQKMKRVIVNILQNSMKYMDKEKESIKVHVNENGEYVQLVFADNGMGIDKDHLGEIFERFYRVEESRNLDAGGTGLGLAIAKQVVEQHGGFITVTSEIGVGTKMIVNLLKSKEKVSTEENIDG